MIDYISVDLKRGKNSIIIDGKDYSDSATEVSTYMSADGTSRVQITFIAKEVEIKSKQCLIGVE